MIRVDTETNEEMNAATQGEKIKQTNKETDAFIRQIHSSQALETDGAVHQQLVVRPVTAVKNHNPPTTTPS